MGLVLKCCDGKTAMSLVCTASLLNAGLVELSSCSPNVIFQKPQPGTL